MRMFLALIALLILISCGGTPFDEDYWDDGSSDDDSQSEDTNSRLLVNLSPVTNVSFVDGDVTIDLNGNDAAVIINMDGVPENIVQGPYFVTDSECIDFSPDAPTTGTTETRTFTLTDNTTRAALFADDTTGDTVEGRNFILYAMAKGSSNTPASALFAYACGPVVSTSDSGNNGGTTGGTTTVVTTGGTTTGTIDGSVGGGIDGSVGGGIDGSVGGVTGTGGAAGGTTVGTTVGGVTGSTTAGSTTGTIGTTFGGFAEE